MQEEESEESLDRAYADALQTAFAEGCVRSDVRDSSATNADTAAHIKVHRSGFLSFGADITASRQSFDTLQKASQYPISQHVEKSS